MLVSFSVYANIDSTVEVLGAENMGEIELKSHVARLPEMQHFIKKNVHIYILEGEDDEKGSSCTRDN